MVVTGPGAWADYLALLRRVSSPVTTPHLFAPGAIAYQYGAGEQAATLVQWTSLVAVALVTVVAWFRRGSETRYLVTIVASQLVSPLLWDHYLMLLLIPVAMLLERRQWWAVLIPPAGWLLPWSYPLTFFVALLAPLSGGGREAARSHPTADRAF